MYLLDTAVVLEARRLKPDIAVRSWIERTPAETMFISAATIGDLRNRVETVRANAPGPAGIVSGWLDLLSATSEIVPMDAASFDRWARLVHSGPARGLEAMLAATALTHDLVVATGNVGLFKSYGAKTFNPYAV